MKEIKWDLFDIRLINDFLIIKSDRIFKSPLDRNRLYRACYALPSCPSKLNEWAKTWLDDDEELNLYELMSSIQ